jgi:hypothetical protein
MPLVIVHFFRSRVFFLENVKLGMGNSLVSAIKVIGRQSDTVGTEYAKTDLCTVAGSGTAYTAPVAGMLLPPDYEFSTKTEGLCSYADKSLPRKMVNADGCGTAESGIGCAIVGANPYYRRVTYGGDKVNCCLNQPKDGLCADGKTCSPTYNDGPRAPACSETFKTYCAEGNRVFGESKCAEWVEASRKSPSGDASFGIVKTFCDKNPLDPNCRIWATSSVDALKAHQLAVENGSSIPDALKTYPGWMDLCNDPSREYSGHCNTGAMTYCKGVADGTIKFEHEERTGRGGGAVKIVQDTALAEKAKSFCGCINSPAAKYNPECIDKSCTLGGYKLTKEQPVCNITSCDVIYQIQGVGKNVEFNDNTILQRCGDAQTIEQKSADMQLATIDAINKAKLAEKSAQTAEEKQSIADQLKAVALKARADADALKVLADENNTAEALTAAEKALDSATQAETEATNAQTVADQAKLDAEDAQKRAEEAEARKVAIEKEEEAKSGESTSGGTDTTTTTTTDDVSSDSTTTTDGTSGTTEKSNTTLYYAIGGGAIVIMVVAVIAYFVFRKK